MTQKQSLETTIIFDYKVSSFQLIVKTSQEIVFVTLILRNYFIFAFYVYLTNKSKAQRYYPINIIISKLPYC